MRPRASALRVSRSHCSDFSEEAPGRAGAGAKLTGELRLRWAMTMYQSWIKQECCWSWEFLVELNVKNVAAKSGLAGMKSS